MVAWGHCGAFEVVYIDEVVRAVWPGVGGQDAAGCCGRCDAVGAVAEVVGVGGGWGVVVGVVGCWWWPRFAGVVGWFGAVV